MSGPIRLLALFALLLSAPLAHAQRSYDTDILRDTFGFDESTTKSVALEDLHQGCPARDCIPSIDAPKYVSATEATHVADEDMVVAISLHGDKRAYPARILDRHEIVNDTIGGVPIAITWCPLCGSAVGIEREVDGEITAFGVSGVLYNSDLVFYDRASNTLWDQVEARGIVGPKTGQQLTLVPVTMTTWSRWRDAHPDTLVLSPDTGFEKDYSRDPYAEYRGAAGLMFPVSAEDDRIHPKSVVHGFDVAGMRIAYTHSLLEKKHRYENQLDELELTATLHDDGSVTLADQHGETYVGTRLFG
ncbi:MAG: DUF3179 domain-containing protein, partial [Woeseiaceae bacterium]